MSDARERLEEANAAIATAVMVLDAARPVLEEFIEESRRMDSVGPILNPTLFMSSERRATEALLKPVYAAALAFLNTHRDVTDRARTALAKVSHG